jgi:hypothetical protein
MWIYLEQCNHERQVSVLKLLSGMYNSFQANFLEEVL